MFPEQLSGAGAPWFSQRMDAPCSIFQFNKVTLSRGGISLWFVTCVATTNQPDTPPLFKCLNTTFSHGSAREALEVHFPPYRDSNGAAALAGQVAALDVRDPETAAPDLLRLKVPASPSARSPSG